MNILYNLCVALNVFIVTIVGMALFLTSLLPNALTFTFSPQLVLIGSSFLFLSFLTAYLDKRLKSEKEGIVIPAPKGKVNITRFALEEFLKKEALGQIGIKSARPRLKIGRGKVSVSIKVEINAIARAVPEIVENLQTSIEAFLKDRVGILNLSKIEVQVVKIIEKEEARIIQLK